jgi:3-hydroxyisobutyrate dehydrogenase-like beta-hydroxyacid dehydrogenase
MARLAFVGLGLMGTPMATRLLDAGHELTVWNRTTLGAEASVKMSAAAAAPSVPRSG